MQVDAWLVYDFRGTNTVLGRLLPEAPIGTRRAFLCIPAEGEPSMLVHDIERTQFQSLGLELECYADRHSMVQSLQARFGSLNSVAMEYSPMAHSVQELALPPVLKLPEAHSMQFPVAVSL